MSESRLYGDAGATAAAILVGGIGGGWDSPAAGLYDRLAEELPAEGIAVLRVRYRRPGDLAGCVEDVLAGARELAAERLALVGHSFGGAVVIQAAERLAATRTVVTIAAQARGADAIRGVRSILLVHGREDEVLAPFSSEQLYAQAPAEKELVLVDDGDHVLDAQAAEVHEVVAAWLRDHLAS